MTRLVRQSFDAKGHTCHAAVAIRTRAKLFCCAVWELESSSSMLIGSLLPTPMCAGAASNGAGKGGKAAGKGCGSAEKAGLVKADLPKAQKQHKDKQGDAMHEGASGKGGQAANGSTNGAEAAPKARHLSKKEKRKLKAAAAAAQVGRAVVTLEVRSGRLQPRHSLRAGVTQVSVHMTTPRPHLPLPLLLRALRLSGRPPAWTT